MFEFFSHVDTIFWVYIAFVLIVLCGGLLTVQGRFFQLRQLPLICASFFKLIGKSSKGQRGVHPLKVFFASVGGMIGVGNIVGIITALQLGGPGALFWIWLTGMIGAIVKYAEIYLGLKYRVANQRGGYDGGPMFFLRKAFKNRLLPLIVAILLCIYGVEVYQFSVMSESISVNWGINRIIVTAGLLISVLYVSLGGVKRIAQICSWIMPFFLLSYVAMGCWILIAEAGVLPSLLATVFKSAFTGHAAVGGFAGATVLATIQYGIARAAYSADIGIGYDSIIQSESSTLQPERQARLAIFGVLVDNIICTFSILIVLLSGIWKTDAITFASSHLVQLALAEYFPYMDLFMPVFLSIVGFTTIIAYFCVGIKCARYLSAKYGSALYVAYGTASLALSGFVEQKHALLVMSIAGALLLIINLFGIFKLRHELSFVIPKDEEDPITGQTIRSSTN